ncbi:hypothetical protein SRCM100623_02296 [Acetobacter pasteurianus]|uniref:Uncharacterized protein n=1 Tax=Acetobacter pasteurianus TaxID=438 RepID=A0A1A0D764_ACEPA|nr:hypothetical protein SRCM100623_02296 [Acetobacter pasteurianus]
MKASIIGLEEQQSGDKANGSDTFSYTHMNRTRTEKY